MNNLNIQKDTGLGSLSEAFNGYNVGRVESTGSIEVVDTRISKVFKKYLHIIENKIFSDYELNSNLYSDEIDSFVQMTAPFKEYRSYKEITGYFISRLIRDSYNNDQNYFKLNLNNTGPLYLLLFGVKAKKENPLYLNVIGDTGNSFCESADNVYATVRGNIGGSSFLRSENSQIFVDGSIGNYVGRLSNNLKLTVHGNILHSGGNGSKNLVASVKGNIGAGFGEAANHFSLYASEDIGRYWRPYVGESIDFQLEPFVHEAISGDDAIKHPTYIKMMKEFERRMNK